MQTLRIRRAGAGANRFASTAARHMRGKLLLYWSDRELQGRRDPAGWAILAKKTAHFPPGTKITTNTATNARSAGTNVKLENPRNRRVS